MWWQTTHHFFPPTTPMATLSFNAINIKHPTFQSHKPISHFSSSLLKSIKIPSLASKPTQNPRKARPISVSESPVSSPLETEEPTEDELLDDPTAELRYLDPETDPDSITEWELDFCSRPILDIRGKKIWELVVCDNSLSLQYTKYFPNNVINSVTLKDAIESVCDELDVPLPEKIRFFRWILIYLLFLKLF